uniref:Uncharacterized protein n=1 Tax=Glossina austeni TaxID=7395 RepID=A0A1A9VL45_GLOAU
MHDVVQRLVREMRPKKYPDFDDSEKITSKNVPHKALPSSSSDSEISESELSSEIASPCMGFIVIVKAESSQRAMDTPLKRITETTQTSIISVVGCELSAAKYKLATLSVPIISTPSLLILVLMSKVVERVSSPSISISSWSGFNEGNTITLQVSKLCNSAEMRSPIRLITLTLMVPKICTPRLISGYVTKLFELPNKVKKQKIMDKIDVHT